ncbi:glucose-6-phosphate dehydrogenase, partial [Citrobacter sp. AAK_AS5]
MISLEDTTGNAVAAAISAERHRMGALATGMVLTLLVLADEETQADA